MTEKELMQYPILKARIERNEHKLVQIHDKEIPVVSGKVKGSSREFPYIETHFSVKMYEPKAMDYCNGQVKRIKNAIDEDVAKIKKIEFFINTINDPELQTVFEMRIYDGMNWMDIAVELDGGKDRTTYAKKFKKYLDNSHNSPISHLESI